MIGKLDELMRVNSEALRLRAQRQEMIASNLANAETPNYKAVDFKFADALRQAAGVQGAGGHSGMAVASPALAVTSNGHISASGVSGSGTGAGNLPVQVLYRNPIQASVDGNTVDMDGERAQFADNAVRYEASLRFLNGQLKTLLSAIQSQ